MWRATWEACSGNLECWEPSQHLLIDTGKPRKTFVEMAGRRTFRILTSSQQPGIYVKKQCPHSTTNTHEITTHTRRLQQYTRSTNNNYTKDNLKLATKHTRQIRILQHVQKVKTAKQDSTVWRKVEKKRNKTWFLLDDNAPAHQSVLVKDFVAKNSVTAL